MSNRDSSNLVSDLEVLALAKHLPAKPIKSATSGKKGGLGFAGRRGFCLLFVVRAVHVSALLEFDCVARELRLRAKRCLSHVRFVAIVIRKASEYLQRTQAPMSRCPECMSRVVVYYNSKVGGSSMPI